MDIVRMGVLGLNMIQEVKEYLRVPVTGDLACAPLFQQHSISLFFGTPWMLVASHSIY